MGNKTGGFVKHSTDSGEEITFDLKPDLSYNTNENAVEDFHEFLYNTPIVEQSQGKIVITTKPEGSVLNPIYGNGFIGTVYEAYNNHRHLVLRPDDIWMAVTTALSLFVNAHAEEMRNEFVDHEGKIELTVYDSGTLYSADWDKLMENMSRQIDNNTKRDTRDWLVPDFSTTTRDIATAAKVTMMAIFQEYFSYKFRFLCGIPKVTLKGKLEDWQNLQLKVQKLKTFNQSALDHWAKLLDHVLSKFKDSYEGNIDGRFWSKICHIEGWGSGPRYCAGWLNVFMPFDTDGKYVLERASPLFGKWCQIDTNSVPPAVVEVPVLINDNGIKHRTKFIAGFLAISYDKTVNTVSPSIDWAIIDLPEENNWKKRMADEWAEMWKTFPKGRYFTGSRT